MQGRCSGCRPRRHAEERHREPFAALRPGVEHVSRFKSVASESGNRLRGSATRPPTRDGRPETPSLQSPTARRNRLVLTRRCGYCFVMTVPLLAIDTSAPGCSSGSCMIRVLRPLSKRASAPCRNPVRPHRRPARCSRGCLCRSRAHRRYHRSRFVLGLRIGYPPRAGSGSRSIFPLSAFQRSKRFRCRRPRATRSLS